jgi:hypothetical protein
MLAFGVVVFLVHSWSVRGFLYKVPSFILYYRLGEVIAIFFYMMAFALLESLLVTLGLLAISFLLPANWFRQGFGYKASLTAIVAAAAMIYLQSILGNSLPPAKIYFEGAVLFVLVMTVLILIANKFKLVQKSMLFVTDRLAIMSFVYVPLGVIGFFVIILRNLW